MTQPADRGRFYWGVKVQKTVASDGEIYFHADRLEVGAAGELIALLDRAEGRPQVNLTLAPGRWLAYYAASCLDGRPIAVDHWAGMVRRDN